MAKAKTTMQDWIVLEDGEYQAESDDGGVYVSRETGLGIATVRLRSDYAAVPKLVESLKSLVRIFDPDKQGIYGLRGLRLRPPAPPFVTPVLSRNSYGAEWRNHEPRKHSDSHPGGCIAGRRNAETIK